MGTAESGHAPLDCDRERGLMPCSGLTVAPALRMGRSGLVLVQLIVPNWKCAKSPRSATQACACCESTREIVAVFEGARADKVCARTVTDPARSHLAPASYAHFPPSYADSIFTRRRTVRARAFVMPHIARLQWISGIACRVLAIILCSGLVHARVPAIGLRSIAPCAFPLPVVAELPRILHLSRGRAERSDRTDEQQDKPSHDASEGGHAPLKRYYGANATSLISAASPDREPS